MKNIAVICNNRNEWRHFVDTLQFSLSKENKPYRAVTEYIVDIEKQVKYVFALNHVSGIQRIRGYLWEDYITMGKYVDKDIHEYLMTNMRGE